MDLLVFEARLIESRQDELRADLGAHREGREGARPRTGEAVRGHPGAHRPGGVRTRGVHQVPRGPRQQQGDGGAMAAIDAALEQHESSASARERHPELLKLDAMMQDFEAAATNAQVHRVIGEMQTRRHRPGRSDLRPKCHYNTT